MLCFVFFFFSNLDWHCSVSVFIKYNSALRRWQQWEETVSSTDFSQIPRLPWGQSLQTSAFTSHWQTAVTPSFHGCPLLVNIYHHVTVARLTLRGAEGEDTNDHKVQVKNLEGFMENKFLGWKVKEYCLGSSSPMQRNWRRSCYNWVWHWTDFTTEF